MWTHTVTVLTVRILLVFQQLTNTDKINLLLVTRSKNSGLFWHLKELVGDWFFRSPLPDSGQVPEIIFQFSGLTSLRSHTSEDRTRHVCTKYCSICERLWMLVPGRILFFLICSGWSSGKGQFRAWLKRTRRKVGGLLWLSTWVVPSVIGVLVFSFLAGFESCPVRKSTSPWNDSVPMSLVVLVPWACVNEQL
jgi:4-amino-4-deoxy-L-arabinose transferase-like glycosyltransferase